MSSGLNQPSAQKFQDLYKSAVEEGMCARDILKWALHQFGSEKLILASSLSAEDQILTHMIAKLTEKPRILMLDTGRHFQETYDVMHATEAKYGFNYEVYFPETQDVEELMRTKGPNSFYTSVANRKECCNIRKVKPLTKALSTGDAWITGLRNEQSVTRGGTAVIEWDAQFNLFKLNPLIHWTETEVWDYIRDLQVPYNKLHDRQFPSIGCAPCTRAVKPGEHVRAGRWWWENPDTKECGLHNASTVVNNAQKKKKDTIHANSLLKPISERGVSLLGMC